MAKKTKAKVNRASKKVAPSKKQKPSQRELTVKDLRDINRHIDGLRKFVHTAVMGVQDRSNSLLARLERLEARVGSPDPAADTIDGEGPDAQAHEHTGEEGTGGD